MTSFDQVDVLQQCRYYGVELELPPAAGLDGDRVMTAIADNESSRGANCGPRHEPAYEADGAPWARAAMAPLLLAWPPVGDPPQSPAACSYGPWQMMFVNFSEGAQQTIMAGTATVEMYASEFVRYFNSYVMSQRPESLAEIGQIWNMGHKAPDTAYTDKLQAAYDAVT